MTKVELYNKMIDLYKKTGQGLPLFPTVPRNIVDELVEEGLVKIVLDDSTYNRIDNICLTNTYCVEEHIKDDGICQFTAIRMYLSHKMLIELGNLGSLSLVEALKNPEIISKYSEWLTKNHAELIKIDTLPYLNDDSDVLSDKIIAFVRKSSWYQENATISECIRRNKKAWDANIKKIGLMEKLSELYDSDSKYKEEKAKNAKSIRINKRNRARRQPIENWLLKQDQSKTIHEVL